MPILPTFRACSSASVRVTNSLLRGSFNPSPKNLNGITSLFENEAKIVLSSIKKLEGSNHPLLAYAKGFSPDLTEDYEVLTSSNSSIKLRSMVVMLVAKSFGFPHKLHAEGSEKSLEAAKVKQRALAEITEMIYTAHMIHRTVVEIPKEQLSVLGAVAKDSSSEDSEPRSKGAALHHGNKLAALMGDILLARSSKGLASLRNATVTERMSESIEDFTESEMIVSIAKDSVALQGNSDLGNQGFASNSMRRDPVKVLTYELWLKRGNLSIGSLLGHSCFSALTFGGHEIEMRKLGSAIGCKIGLAMQAFKDYSMFEFKENSDFQPHQFDLCSLPVIYHLERNPNLLSGVTDNYKIYEEVKTSQFALERTKETLLVLLDDVHRLLSKLPATSPSSKVLKEFLSSLS